MQTSKQIPPHISHVLFIFIFTENVKTSTFYSLFEVNSVKLLSLKMERNLSNKLIDLKEQKIIWWIPRDYVILLWVLNISSYMKIYN